MGFDHSCGWSFAASRLRNFVPGPVKLCPGKCNSKGSLLIIEFNKLPPRWLDGKKRAFFREHSLQKPDRKALPFFVCLLLIPYDFVWDLHRKQYMRVVFSFDSLLSSPQCYSRIMLWFLVGGASPQNHIFTSLLNFHKGAPILLILLRELQKQVTQTLKARICICFDRNSDKKC